jgi:hypothetical protein
MNGRLVLAAVLVAGVLCPRQALAQVPARFYWKTLEGASAVPVIANSITGNTNPFDPSHTVTAGASFDAQLLLAGYAHFFSLFNRAAMAAALLPMGKLSGEVTVAGNTSRQSADGFGDPMFELTVNVLGPRSQKDLPAAMRYEPGFSVDLLGDLAVPVGEYDSSQPLNLGQHRVYGRLGAPVVWQLGPWVPGRRTTLELLPAVWLFGPNDNYVGQTLKTDPLYQLDAHLTRDFIEDFWGSLDLAWYLGGQATVHGAEGKMLNNLGVGLTFGYVINDNMNLTIGYKSTVNGSDPADLRMSGLMVSFVCGWHPLLEGVKRLQGGK